jgi:putative transposase
MARKPFKHRGGAYNINYHIVFCTKYRHSVLVGNIAQDCKKDFTTAVEKVKGKIEAMEVMPDHVHLFISVEPKISPNSLIKKLKGATSKHLRTKYPQLMKMSSLWSSSYYVGTVGMVSESVVKLYIENQKGV